MGQKSRLKKLAREQGRPEPRTTASPSSSGTAAQMRRRHPWAFRLAAAVVLPALLLGFLELGLRLFGCGYSTKFFERLPDGKSLTTNQKFAWQFYAPGKATSPAPIVFPHEKAPGTFRIFVLGESAAAGTPDPAFGFARQLDLMLADQYPGKRFEVVNAAMRGIDSFVVRQIAAECATLSPDLFVVYTGNNDMIGLHAPSAEEFQLSSNNGWLRLQHAVRRARVAQLVEGLLRRVAGARQPKAQDMEFFRRQRLAPGDPRREPVYENFAANLRGLCASAAKAGAGALVCTVGVNQRDFPPLGSMHRRGLEAPQLTEWDKHVAQGVQAEARGDFAAALASYGAAEKLDDKFAELLFRMARCHEVLGRMEEARRYFGQARDCDAIQFRTDSRLNNLSRSLATNSGPNIRLADMEQRLAANPLATNGILGGGIYQEHVHFRFEGDHLMAQLLVPEVASALKLPAPARPFLTRDECARRLAYTVVDDYNVRSAIVQLTGGPPFLDQLDHAGRQTAAERELRAMEQRVTGRDFDEALGTYRQAVAARPEDTMIRYNFGKLLKQIGQRDKAAEQYAFCVSRLPASRVYRVSYGNLLMELGRAREAVTQFEAALQVEPGLKPVQQALATARARAR